MIRVYAYLDHECKVGRELNQEASHASHKVVVSILSPGQISPRFRLLL